MPLHGPAPVLRYALAAVALLCLVLATETRTRNGRDKLRRRAVDFRTKSVGASVDVAQRPPTFGPLLSPLGDSLPAGTYTATTLCTAINSAFVTAVNARSLSMYDSPTVVAATATGPLISEINLFPSEEVQGQYRADFE